MSIKNQQLEAVAESEATLDATTIDQYTQPDAKLPGLGLVASLSEASAALIPDALYRLIEDQFAVVSLALASFETAKRERVVAGQHRDRVISRLQSFELPEGGKPAAVVLRRRRLSWGIVLGILAVMALQVVTDGFVLREVVENLGLAGIEKSLVAFSIAGSIAALSYYGASAAAQALARGQRLRAAFALSLSIAIAGLMVLVFSTVRALVLGTTVESVQAQTAQAERSAEGAPTAFSELISSAAQSTLTALPTPLAVALFATLMSGTVILTVIKFLASNPREDWASELQRAADEAERDVVRAKAHEQEQFMRLLSVRTRLEALPTMIMAESLSTRSQANARGWQYRAALARSVPRQYAQVIRELPEPAHELPDWTEGLITAVQPARRAALDVLSRVSVAEGGDPVEAVTGRP